MSIMLQRNGLHLMHKFPMRLFVHIKYLKSLKTVTATEVSRDNLLNVLFLPYNILALSPPIMSQAAWILVWHDCIYLHKTQLRIKQQLLVFFFSQYGKIANEIHTFYLLISSFGMEDVLCIFSDEYWFIHKTLGESSVNLKDTIAGGFRKHILRC